MKTILITGSSGNLGRAVVRKFLDEGYKVVGTDMRMHPENAHENFEHITVDLIHAPDERVPDEAIRFGVDCLVDAIRRFHGEFASGSPVIQ